MKLEDFVRKTLLDITNGVPKAQETAPSWIAPGRVEGEVEKTPQLVSFEVVVTTSKEGNGEINIWSIGEAGAKASSQHTNKISFGVPVYFQTKKTSNES